MNGSCLIFCEVTPFSKGKKEKRRKITKKCSKTTVRKAKMFFFAPLLTVNDVLIVGPDATKRHGGWGL